MLIDVKWLSTIWTRYAPLCVAGILLSLPLAGPGAVLVSRSPALGGGVSRWSQLWQDPGPGGNDLDSDAICWADFNLQSPTTITHLEWWGTGACELGFQIEFWPQDPGTIAYQPLAVFDRGPGPSPVTPTARFVAAPEDYATNNLPDGLTHFSLDLATPVALEANDTANPRWFIGIIGLTHQAYATWNWSQSSVGNSRTYQWYRGDANRFRSLGDGRALLLADATPDLPPRMNIAMTSTNSLLISWPASAIGFVLQENTSFVTTNWSDVTNKVSDVSGESCVAISLSPTNCYYRLFQR